MTHLPDIHKVWSREPNVALSSTSVDESESIYRCVSISFQIISREAEKKERKTNFVIVCAFFVAFGHVSYYLFANTSFQIFRHF